MTGGVGKVLFKHGMSSWGCLVWGSCGVALGSRRVTLD